MKNSLYFTALTLFLIFLVAGCNKLEGDKPSGPVIATVDDIPITENDFLEQVGRVPEWARTQFRGEEGKDRFLDELIKRELIYQHARKMNLDNDKEYKSKVREFEKMTLVSLVLKKEVEEQAVVDDTEVKAFFEQNEDKFTIGTQLKASHILVETEDEAKSIIEKINSGESFEKLAREYSKDKGSADKGGDLGYFGRGKMVPEFENAAASLKPGEISDPVMTRFGYHVIKLTDLKKGKPANFEQSKDSIKKQLLADKRKRLFDSFVDKLKLETSITKDNTKLYSISLPWEKTEETKPAEEQTADQQEQPKSE